MEEANSSKHSPRQFSIYSVLVLMAILACCFAFGASRFWRAKNKAFERTVVHPFLAKFVASVGTNNRQVVWLRLNGIEPQHPNGFDEFVVDLPLDVMFINNGSFGPYKQFDDADLKTVVEKHPHIRALDLRTTLVTSEGLESLSKLKRLKWLWLDDSHRNEKGFSSVRSIPTLRVLWLNFADVDTELLDSLRHSSPELHLVDLDGRDDVPPPSTK